jgi:hypothetical protein
MPESGAKISFPITRYRTAAIYQCCLSVSMRPWHDPFPSAHRIATCTFIIRRSLIPLTVQYLLRYKLILSSKQTNKQVLLLTYYYLSFKMQLQTLFLALATTLLPLVSGEACVAGGPADQVTAANNCCKELTGTWYVPSPSSLSLLPSPFLLLLHTPSFTSSLRSQVRHESQPRNLRAPRLGNLLVEALRARDPRQCGLARHAMYPWGW